MLPRPLRTSLDRCWYGATLSAILLFRLSEVAWAAPPSSPGGLEQPTDRVLATLIAQSLAARPELARARAEVKAERDRVPQAGAPPDPVLQLGVQNDGFTSWEVGEMENSYYSIMVSQTLPWPGRLRLRSEIAELGANQAEQNVARARLSTEAEVRRAYLDLILARDRLALLGRLEAIWQKSAAIARSRYETGQGAQSDVLRAQLEGNRIQQRRWAMQADVAVAVQTLNRLRGHRLDEPIETTVHLVDLPDPVLRDPASAAREALERSPELAAARLGVSREERSISLARKSYLPDFTVNVAVMPRGRDLPTMWLASVAVPLPVFAGSKQSRAVAESEARVLSSQRNAGELEQVLRLRAQQRHTALGAMLASIRLYRDGLLIQSQASLDSTLAQYQVGKVTFASVLEANAGFVADQDGYLQAVAQAHRLDIDRLELSIAPVTSASAGMGTAAMPGAGSTRSGIAGPGTGPAAGAAPGGNSSAM